MCGAMCLALVAGLVGCQTGAGRSAGLGALIGATAGAIIGGHSGSALGGAAIGAAAGAVAGAVIHDVGEPRTRRTRTAEATAVEYHYQPSQGESLVFEDARMLPSVVRRGQTVEASMQYAVLGTGPGQEVTETRLVKRGGELLSQISSKLYTRNDGTWVSLQEFRVPEDWTPGEYTLEQVVSTQRLTVSGVVRFFVE